MQTIETWCSFDIYIFQRIQKCYQIFNMLLRLDLTAHQKLEVASLLSHPKVYLFQMQYVIQFKEHHRKTNSNRHLLLILL